MVHLSSIADGPYLGLKMTEKAKEIGGDSYRRSLLPQKATARQSLQPVNRAKPSINAPVKSIKENPYKPKSISNVEKEASASSREQDKKTASLPAEIPVILPTIPVSLRKERPKNNPGPGRFQTLPSTDSVSRIAGPRNLAVSRSYSLKKSVLLSKSHIPPSIMPKQTNGPTTGPSSVSIDAATNENSCVQRSSDQVTCIPGSQPIQRGEGRSGSVQSMNRPLLSTATERLGRKSSNKEQRPPFSNFQQHFSPKKNLQNRKASSSVQADTNVRVSSSEIFHSQRELMQLHLLHRSAAQVQIQWQESADQSIKDHFATVYKRSSNFQRCVQIHQASLNQYALLAWCKDASNVELAQNVQLLSRNIKELWKLGDSGSMYVSVLKSFESWLVSARHLRDCRKHEKGLGQGLGFIESIGDDWRTDISILERKLATYSRELSSIGKPQKESTLGHALSAFQTMAANFMDELDVIRRIESDVLIQEKVWVESQVSEVIDTENSDTSLMAPASHLGVWNDPLEQE